MFPLLPSVSFFLCVLLFVVVCVCVLGGRRGGPRADVDTTKFYTLLGIEKSASEAEVKKAFRKQAMTHHPDRGGNAETFKVS